MGATAAIVLAAGASRRMGRPKQLLNWRGQPLVRHVVREVLACQDVYHLIVVTGANAEGVMAVLEDLPVQTVHNPDYQDGLAASLRRGVRAVTGLTVVSRILVCLADQPSVPSTYFDELLRAQADDASIIVGTAYPDGQVGVPACFPRTYWAKLAEEGGDAGAKAVMRENGQYVHTITPGFMLFDIDTPEDYARHAGDR